MKSMHDKYKYDPNYTQIVDFMENMIYQNQFTPSEVREMAVLASIHYEMHNVRPAFYLIAEKHLIELEKIREQK